MTPEARRRQAGYTLVELIVATTIGTMVLGALTSVLLTTVLTGNVATSRVEAANQVRSFQLSAYDDMALSTIPGPAGCGTQADPCTTEAIVLQGSRVPNQPAGSPAPYSVSYVWDSATRLITRRVSGGPSKTIATNVSSFSWYVDAATGRPTIVVDLTVRMATYNAIYTDSESLRFYPRLTSP